MLEYLWQIKEKGGCALPLTVMVSMVTSIVVTLIYLGLR